MRGLWYNNGGYSGLRSVLTFLIVVMVSSLRGQTIIITGVVVDSVQDDPVEFVTVYQKGTSNFTETDESGNFKLSIDSDRLQVIGFSRIGYDVLEMAINPEIASEPLQIFLLPSTSELGVIIRESRLESAEMIRESAEAIKFLPSATGNLESALPHIALGARSGTGGELSSQYNVRGGNYDENLVYINDFEIFRPQLLRSSQQEGLSFPNIDLIRDLTFSSGGFSSKYGDKMSSVLDIRYKRPEDFKGSVSASLLGGSAHIEGSRQIGPTAYQKLRYLVGARYKTTKYLLGSLDVEGEYAPEFADVQGYVTLDINRDWQAGFMANYNESRYDFIPKSRSTALGLIDFALMLNSVFTGSESDLFRTGMMGTSITYLPEREKNPVFVKILASAYRGLEIESMDISGFYRLSQVESDIGSEDVGEEVALLGLGTQQEFSRNRLFNQIYNAEIKGGIEIQSEKRRGQSNFLQWGAKMQREHFDDRLNEWERIDSAGYSLPFSETAVLLYNVLKSENLIESNKYQLYLQNTFTALRPEHSEWKFTFGTRFSHWDLTGESIFSPRFELLAKPLKGSKDLSFKLAGGLYAQTPLYRELRRRDGTLNRDLKSQKSLHLVAGMTKDFNWPKVSEKPFRFIFEAYYKKLSNLVSYDINNVRIRYSGANDASGHALGLDFRLNGEFVPGAESWFNISFLRTRESLDGMDHQRIDSETGDSKRVADVPRPTDQFFNLSVFFQDYLPQNENFRVNLNMVFGTGLPFGLPEDNLVFRNVFRYKPYRRVDIGFAYHLWNEEKKAKNPTSFWSALENAWISLEVFNLIGIDNVSSNTWVQTIFDQQFAVPNNLTNRRVNVKFRLEF